MKSENRRQIEMEDWAEDFFKKTGKTVYDLIQEGKTVYEIQMEFKKVGLRRPPRRCVLGYKEQLKDPSKMFKKLDFEFREFVRSKLGGAMVGENVILNAILTVGYNSLMKKMDVSVNELIKAIDLKLKMNNATSNPEEIEKQLEEILKEGKNN
mgnify:CR=1 FL=1